MTNIIYIATSLDGFIATRGGGIEWLNEIPNPKFQTEAFLSFVQH